MPNPGHFISNRWGEGTGDTFRRASPVNSTVTWEGGAASAAEVDAAVKVACDAQPAWVGRPLDERIKLIEAFAAVVKDRTAQFVDAICRETGKPRWEAATEVDAMVRKSPISVAAFRERRAPVESRERRRSHGDPI